MSAPPPPAGTAAAGRAPLNDEQRKQMHFLQELAGPEFPVTESVFVGLNTANKGDMDKMTDDILTMMVRKT
jgi:hypothetical protein